MRIRRGLVAGSVLAGAAMWGTSAPLSPAGADTVQIAMVSGSVRPPAGDVLMAAQLASRGTVTVVDDDALGTTDLTGFDLVAVASSVTVSKVGSSLKDIGVPLITWEAFLFDDLALASSSGETPTNFDKIRIVSPGSPLAAGLTGTPKIANSASKLSYGIVPNTATKVATVPGYANRAAVFAYDTGDRRADGTAAPSCRVGLFPTYEGAPKLNNLGKSVVGAAIDWALDCGPAIVDVQVLALNDFHGNLLPPAGSSGRVNTSPPGQPIVNVDAGGATFLATHVATLEAANPNTTVVSAGDLIGASPILSALFHDEPTIEAMNDIGLDINAVGNHEFDEGATELLRMQNGGCHPVDGCQDGTPYGGADFQFLAANVVDSGGDTLFPAYEIKSYQGAEIAYIGMTLEGTPSIVSPSGVVGLDFLDEADTVNALMPELTAKGVDAVIVVVHEGGLPSAFNAFGCEGISGAIVDIVNRLDQDVDLVISGHTHQPYSCVIDGIPVTSAFSFGRMITDVDLQIDRVSRQVTSMTINNRVVTRTVAEDASVAALIARYNSLAAPIANRPIGQITTDILRLNDPSLEQPLGNLIADAQLAATDGPTQGGAQVAFMNPGGVRTDLIYATSLANEGDGVVTFGESFAVQPFGNNLVTLDLTGAQIELMLEQQFCGANAGVSRVLLPSSGFYYRWSAGAIGSADCAVADAVPFSSITLNGNPLVASTTYRVTVNNFLADGGDGFSVLPSGTNRLGGVADTDALEAYFAAAGGPLAPPATNRIDLVVVPI